MAELAKEIVMAAANCPGCGMEKNEWPNPTGVQRDNATYCCNGCASGTGCTCVKETVGGGGRTSGTSAGGERPAKR